MKKLLLFPLLSLLFINTNSAQEVPTKKTKESFIEWNFGVAFVHNVGVPLPGTSVLWGKTYIDENNFIFEYEAGFALPTLVTGKIGVGKKFHNTKVVVGVRPFPFNLFAQSSFPAGKKGYWIASIEMNPFSSSSRHLSSKGILNFGYRWNLGASN
jgi:hypothetical protein